MRRLRRWRLGAVTLLVAAAAGISACGGSGSGETSDTATAASSSSDIHVIAVGGPLVDPFWGAVKQGTDQAGRDLGIRMEYTAPANGDNIVADYTTDVEAAINRRPDALILGLFFPNLEKLVKRAMDAGIPVFVFDAGFETWEKAGALGYVGEDPTAMGRMAGEQQAAAGVRNGVCVNGVAGNPTQEARCNGYIEGLEAAGGRGKSLVLNYKDQGNPAKIAAVIRSELADGSVDGIYTIAAGLAVNAIQAVEQSGRSGEVTIGTNDLSTDVLRAIKDDELLFALDHQPFEEGYLSVVAATHYAKYGMQPVGRIVTGPLLVDRDNVDQVIEIDKEHPGIRGAA